MSAPDLQQCDTAATQSQQCDIPPTGDVASYVGGTWRTDAPGGRLTSVDPATGAPVAEALLADAAGFVAACTTARDAQRDWAATPAP
ncbi:MAG: hypothetical protein JOY78_14450, partial [Pseudonocardia sp.]|nr:hypothetical protein [Pseudonocardia sp.]